MSTISNPLTNRKHQPELISGTFLTGDGLPVANVLSESMIVDAFRKRNAMFGESTIATYGTTLTLWAFLLQVLSDGKQRSCSAAVSRIIAYALENDIAAPTGDTGNYCSARAKLDPDAIRDLMQSVNRTIDKNTPMDRLWKNRRVLLVDGFTNTLDATDENLAMFPHPRTQKEGVGMSIMRTCVITSLTTGLVVDAVFAAYSGKGTGEPSLCRKMLDSLDSGDVVVFDRYYCSWFMLALFMNKGVDVCTRMHQCRVIGATGRPIGSSAGQNPSARHGWIPRPTSRCLA